MKIIRVFDVPKHFTYELTNNVLKHCKTYINATDRNASLFAWFCLSKFISLKKIKFAKNGKPYLSNNKMYISLSHSYDKVAIAISDGPIGIDIEKIVSNKMALTLAKRLLDQQQFSRYKKLRNKTLWLTKYWTKCEAIIKMCGKPISNDAKIFIKQIDDEYLMSYAIKKKES